MPKKRNTTTGPKSAAGNLEKFVAFHFCKPARDCDSSITKILSTIITLIALHGNAAGPGGGGLAVM